MIDFLRFFALGVGTGYVLHAIYTRQWVGLAAFVATHLLVKGTLRLRRNHLRAL